MLLGLVLAYQTNRLPSDTGVTSVIAVASLSPHQSTVGDINFVGVAPAARSEGRLSVWMGFGSDTAKSDPTTTMPSRPNDIAKGATDPDRQGMVLLAGGAFASSLAACLPNVPIFKWKNIRFDSLSPIEQAAAVKSVETQLQDRTTKYGQVQNDNPEPTPLDLAASMTYTIIEPKQLSPGDWSVENYSSGESQDDASAPQRPSTSTVYGYSAFFQCDADFEQLWTEQPNGPRWELPAIAISAPETGELEHTVSRIGVDRIADPSTFAYSSSSGLESAFVEENWAGANYQRLVTSTFGKSPVAVSSPSVVLTWSAVAAVTMRDVNLFLAGVLLSLFASTLVVVIKQIRARRR